MSIRDFGQTLGLPRIMKVLRCVSDGKMTQALALYEQVRDEMVVKLSADHPNTISILEHLARMYVAFRRTAEAISLAEHVRDSHMLTLGAFHPYTIQTLETLGLAYEGGKQPEKALAALEQAAASALRSSISCTSERGGSLEPTSITWKGRVNSIRPISGGGSG